MEILRKTALVIISPVLSLALFLLIISWVLVSHVGSPTQIKQTLAESKVYDNLLQVVIDKTNEEAQKSIADQAGPNTEKAEEINFNQPEIIAAAKKSLTPQFFQTTSEEIIDGVFGWLDGTTEEPEISIDISTVKTSFIESVADSAVKRVDALPVCTTVAEATATDDPFKATCRPPEFNTAQVKQEFLSKVNSQDGPLSNNVITFDNLQKEGEQPITKKIEAAPKIYQLFKKLPLILLGVIALLVGLIVLLSPQRIRALGIVGKILIGSGLVLLILGLIFWFASGKATIDAEEQIQIDFLNALKATATSIRNSLLIGGGVYVLTGVICLLALRKYSAPLTEEQKHNNINKVLRTKELDDKDAVPLEDLPEKPEESSEPKPEKDNNPKDQ